MNRTLARILVLVACLGGTANVRASEAGNLSLAATVGKEVLTQFAVDKNQIVSRRGAVNSPVPANAVWQLAGDLRASADLFLFAPEYEIVNRLSIADTDADPVLRNAIIRPRRHSGWTDDELKDGVMVFVWLVERKAVAIVPVPSFKKNGSAGEFAAVATIPLTETTAHGAPAVLLWKNDRFIPPTPWFGNKAANAALAAFHFASADEQRAALSRIRDPNVRSQNSAQRAKVRSAIQVFADAVGREVAPITPSHAAPPSSLLYFAAEGGFTDAVATLLEAGANADLDDPDVWGPVHAAASNGRYEALQRLLARQPPNETKQSWRLSPLDVAISNGQATTASALISDTADPAFPKVARMAMALGDETAIRELLRKGAGSVLTGLPEGLLARQVQRGDPQVLQALLDAGMPANATAGGTPLLVLAAASGNSACVNLLLLAHAPTEDRAEGGTTALMTAASLGKLGVVDDLLSARANVDAVDENGLSALHYAVLASRREVVLRLLEHHAHFLADKQGHSPLHVALTMRSKPMVEALVDHGARFDDADVTDHALLLHAIAVDSAALLAQAAEIGWDPNLPFFERWPASQVAGFYDADRCIAWLATRIKPEAPTDVAIAKGDTPAVAIDGKSPAEPRTKDESYPADVVKVTGIVSAAGELLFPHIAASGDERTGAAVLKVAPSWRFHPATKQGAAVASRVALSISFPGRDRRVHASTDLESAPTVTSTTAPEVSSPAAALSATLTLPDDIPPTDQWAAVTLIVETDGEPSAIQIIDAARSSYAEFVELAVKRYRFAPATMDGHPVRTRITLTFPVVGL